MGLTQYAANLFLDGILGNGYFPPSLNTGSAPATPTSLYVALFTTSPSADGTGGVEVAGNGYARSRAEQNTTNWPAASAGSKSNGAAFSWGTASGGSWGTVVAWGVYDASSGGNLLLFGPLTQPQTIANGDSVQVPAGGLVVSLT